MSDLRMTDNKKWYPLGKQVCLGSSSMGNSFYLEINRKDYPHKPFRLLLDCGFTMSELRKRAIKKGINLNDIDAVLVTHEHNDHSLATKDLWELLGRKNIFAPRQVFEKCEIPLDRVDSRFIMEERKLKYIADGIAVFGIPLEHDVYNLGYIIILRDNFKIGFFTDTGMIKQRMRTWRNPITKVKEPLHLNVIFIEANYITYRLKFAIKGLEDKQKDGIHLTPQQVGKLFLWKRVLETHMSVERTGMILAGNERYDSRSGKLISKFDPIFDISKTDIIYLMHLTTDSSKNPFEYRDIVERYIKKANLKVPKIVVLKNGGEMT